ncbi:outer membrane protein assembly factor BamE [Aurantiacibacter aquimixticola]|uniref:Outer membrane protein assembly factor BamE n=1 Tax=Aurantiacibacter aquimixticola TaxID=1958945 RepID=A0A419RVU8_9SPHN|nr:outer membrane protein assembly factor BamE [Aurantiacibacter aquimixticola]RJY09894.1 outer membrane protein assembly factor BamE [Aurantiacibacter aquimixticola]
MGSIVRMAALAGLGLAVAGCSSITNHRGYIVDETLVQSVQPGIDNQQSVQGTLGQPTMKSQFGQPVWYYISSQTEQAPFRQPTISQHTVFAVYFDEAGNVVSTDRSGMEQVARIDPESDTTPTLGRERGFLEDLFGNIGTVGAPGAGAPGAGGGR